MKIIKNETDYHLHTIVSDGEMTPNDILTCAHELHLKEISITDHDAIGAYTNFKEDPFARAKELGITLIPGIEMDSNYSGIEVHILGYGINLKSKELNDYLQNIQKLRKQRVREQISQINAAFKSQVLKEEEIITPERDTVMKPHIIHTLLNKGCFKEYGEASQWVSKNTRPATEVPKPSSTEIIQLVKRAEGRAFLAHPGYYVKVSGINIDEMIENLLPHGLDGLEVLYAYFNTGSKFPTRESEEEIVQLIAQTAQKYGLLTSQGSDAHQIEQMRAFRRGDSDL